MLLDSFLNLCRLVMKSIPEVCKLLVDMVASLLYVIIGKNTTLSSELTATLVTRVRQILDLCPIAESGHCLSLWQCYLKLMAGYGRLEDGERIDLLERLIIIAAAHPAGERSRWLQFIRLAFKLNKHSLQRKKFPESGIISALNVLKDLLPNDPLVKDFLDLPVTGSVKNEGWIKSLRSLVSEAFQEKEHTLAAIILTSTSKSAWSDIFAESPRFRSLHHLPAFDAGNVESWLLASCCAANFTSVRQREAFIEDLITLIATGVFDDKNLKLVILLKSTLQTLLQGLTSHSKLFNSPLRKLVVMAHCPKHLLTKATFGETFEVYQKLKDCFGNNHQLLYWPIAVMSRCAREMLATPSECARLFEISLNDLQNPQLMALSQNTILDCWSCLEYHHMHQILPLLSSTTTWFCCRLLLKSFTTTLVDNNEHFTLSILNSIADRYEISNNSSTNGSIDEFDRLEILRYLEIFFKFYPHIDQLEVWLDQHPRLQGDLIGFLKRDKSAPPSLFLEENVEYLEDSLKKRLVKFSDMAPLKLVEQVSNADDEFDRLLRELEAMLDGNHQLSSRRDQLRSWLFKRKIF